VYDAIRAGRADGTLARPFYDILEIEINESGVVVS
jgi:hypothetical protein